MSTTSNAVAYLKAVSASQDEALKLSHEDSPVFRQFTKGLIIAYIVDAGNSYTYIQNRHLLTDGLDLDQLHALAINNLIDLADRRSVRIQAYQNIFAVFMGGDFEASLLLIDHLWESVFRRYVKGEYAVAIPARDVLAFCDSASAMGISELHQLIGRIMPGGDHLLSPRILLRRSGTWVAQDG
jgi:uncharacterized protein YtpQ (UPF0354 family)